jgi:hypothetical protein
MPGGNVALTYEQLTEILLQSGEPFTIEEPRSDGKTNVYRGNNAKAFLAKADRRRHEHKVFDQQGKLVYHRDVNGRLYVGDPEQIAKYARSRKAAGNILRTLGYIVNTSMRHWGLK